MSLGFEQAGFDVVAAVDCEKKHVQTHEKNFPNCKTICASLSNLSGNEILAQAGMDREQKIDVLFGGPPCQGFSLIGKRDTDDPRNQHLYDFARLVKELQPLYFVLENVSGLLAGDAKRMLEAFVRRANHAGYTVVKPVQILDAADYGVPQHRKRVFVIGHKTKLPAPNYPAPCVGADSGAAPPTVWAAIGDLPNVDDSTELLSTDVYTGELGVPSAYASVLRGASSDPSDHGPKRPAGTPRLTGCLRTSHTSETVKRFAATGPGTTEPISRFYRLSKEGLSHTIRAGTGPDKGSFMAPRPIHPIHARCITVREAARLHSFPDWFCFHPTKWHGFRQVGNSVPPLLARAVAASIMDALAALDAGRRKGQ